MELVFSQAMPPWHISFSVVQYQHQTLAVTADDATFCG